MLHHVAYAGPLEPCFAEARRLLRPGGALVAIEPNIYHPIGAALSLANRAGLGVRVHGTPDDIPLSPRRLAATRARRGSAARAARGDVLLAAAAGPRAARGRRARSLRLGARAALGRAHVHAHRAPLMAVLRRRLSLMLAWPSGRLAVAIGVLATLAIVLLDALVRDAPTPQGDDLIYERMARGPVRDPHLRLRLPRRGAVGRARAPVRAHVLVQHDRVAVLRRGRRGPLPAARAPRHLARRVGAACVRARAVAAAARRERASGTQPGSADRPRDGHRRAVHRRAPPEGARADDAGRGVQPRVRALPRAARLRGLGAATVGPCCAGARAGGRGARDRRVLRAALRDPDGRTRAGARLRRVADRRPASTS